PANATGSRRLGFAIAGTSSVLGVFANDWNGGEDLAGPAQSRPRGRPFWAYAMRGVEGMAAAPLVRDV
ncbi:hypothetical protein ACOTF2_11010, partial [Achromobacter xylosoxidans]